MITKNYYSNNKQEYSIKIENININGEGVSYINNKKVCVKNVLPNEEVIVQEESNKGDFVFANLKEVKTKNGKRKEPSCPYFSVCGGCDFQMLIVSDALYLKQEILTNYFKDLYSGTIKLNFSPKSFNYRNKVVFAVNKNKIGLVKEKTNKIVEISNCLIANNEINKIYNIVKNYIKNNNDNGNVIYVVVRSINNKSIITFVCKKLKLMNQQNLILLLQKEYGTSLEDSVGIYINLKSQKKEILSNNYKHIMGLEYLVDNYENIYFNVHPHSFLQVNNEVRDFLYKRATDFVKDEIVIEGYSGIGILSAILSKNAKKVYSVELNHQATKDANILMADNKIKNVININGNCKDVLPKLIKENKKAMFVIDPPRSGCDGETLKALIDNNIQKILYISCNAYTLKQNLVYLKDYYIVKEMEIFDMFPNTSQVETMVYLERKN